MKTVRKIVCWLIIGAMPLCFAGSAEAKSKNYEKEYRRRVIEACMEGSTSKNKYNYCACGADGGMRRFSIEELEKNGREVKKYMEEHVYPICFDEHLTPEDKVEFMSPEDKLIAQAADSFKNLGTNKEKSRAPEATAPAAPAAATPVPQPQSPRSVVRLKNGQTVAGSIVEKNQKGIWVEFDGMKVYFSHAEIKQIDEPHS